MKTLRWMTFFAAMATLSLFTGCDKDDDNNTTDSEEPVAAEIAGTYSGKAAVTASGMSMGENDAVASLAEETGSTYSLVLNDLVVNPPFPNSEMEIGDVTFENVSITDGEFVGEYNISVEVDLPQTLSDMVGGMEKMTLPVSLVSGNWRRKKRRR